MAKMDKPFLLGEMRVYTVPQANAPDSEADLVHIRAIKMPKEFLIGNTWMNEIILEKKDEPDALGNDRWSLTSMSIIHPRCILGLLVMSFEARESFLQAQRELSDIRRALSASPINRKLDITMAQEVTMLLADKDEENRTTRTKFASITNEEIAKAWTGNDINTIDAVDLHAAENVIHMICERIK